jgi:chromosome segregation ATPase
MSDNKTKETNQSRSFEERVFARFDLMDSRFDALDSRLDGLDKRVEKLESRQYDTKPIWEQALASITETNKRLDENNRKLDETNKRLDETNERMGRGFELLRNEMKTEFTAVRHEMEHSIRGVERKIDVLNQNILNLQVDQRYVDRRLPGA